MNKLQAIFKDKEITFKEVNGEVYVSATQMAKAFPKKNLSTWINSDGTKEYIKALCSKTGNDKDFYQWTSKGFGANKQTWLHEKLTLDLAKWLSVEFRIWCDEQIVKLLKNGFVIFEKEDRSYQHMIHLKHGDDLPNIVMNKCVAKLMNGYKQEIRDTEDKRLLEVRQDLIDVWSKHFIKSGSKGEANRKVATYFEIKYL